MSRRLLWIGFAASLAAGCATSPEVATKADPSLEFTQTGKHAHVDPVAPLRPTAQPETLGGDPYGKTAGGVEGHKGDRDGDPDAVVRFVPPADELRPATPLSGPVTLGVVFVRDGVWVHDPEALLELDSLLAADEEIQRVLALRPPGLTDVGLEGLTLIAVREGRELLFVEIREGGRRRAYLLNAQQAAVVARYDARDPPDTHAVAAGPPGVARRVGVAFGRLRR